MNKSEYSSILKKVPFRYIESLRIAKMMAEGFSFEKIQQSYLDFNEGKVVSEVRKKEVVNTLFVRLSNLDRVLLDQFIHADIATSKFILVYAIAKGDKLFSEFLLLCYRSALIGEKKYISLADFDDFFASEKEKNVSIAKWGRGTIEDLSTSYRNIFLYFSNDVVHHRRLPERGGRAEKLYQLRCLCSVVSTADSRTDSAL